MVDPLVKAVLGAPSRVVVDGNNVMGSRPDGWWRDRPAAAARLVTRLGALAARGPEVVVVFDGPAAEAEAAGVEVRTATRSGRDAADDVIADLVATAPDARTLVVVTADRALRDRVTAAGAFTVGPRTLLDLLDRLED